MEITKGTLPNGNPCITFKDQFDEKCEMIVSPDTLLRFAFEDVAYLSQEDMKALLPYLQAFAESGTFEPQESPLQGVDGKIAMTAVIEDPKKRIEALIQLFHQLLGE